MSTKYQRYTRSQLTSLARKLEKKYDSDETTPKQRAKILIGLRSAARGLRAKTIAQIDVKLNTLKGQIAKRLDISINSPKATSPAIKRLNLKRRQICNSTNIDTLVKLCSDFKVSSYKNPLRTSKARAKSKPVAIKYKKQTSTLKREIKNLKRRNSFMKKQVAKFRKEVTLMQRHYGTLNNIAPKMAAANSKRVTQDVSNIVRFSNALNNAVLKQHPRKAS